MKLANTSALRQFFESESLREQSHGYPWLTKAEIDELVTETIKRIPISMGPDTAAEYVNRWFRERHRELQDYQI